MKFLIHPHDLSALGSLVVDSVHGLTDLVEDLHRKISGISPDRPTGGVPGLVYRSVRTVTNLTRMAGTPLAQLISSLEKGDSTPGREATVAVLNGIMGDHLASTGNSLAIPMRFRQNGQALDLDGQELSGLQLAAVDNPHSKVLVLVHGLCMNDLQWMREGHDHGAALAQELGYTSIYLNYNTGQHISTNGRSLTDLLDSLVQQWPVPVEELVIVAHSMGGLVTRSACHYAALQDQHWLPALRKVIFLGTPHHGSHLEVGGHWLHTILAVNGYTAPFARLGKIRSAGITDMRYGSLLDEDWDSHDRFAHPHPLPQPMPLPPGVEWYTIAAVMKGQDAGAAHALFGDGLVRLDSALGQHTDPLRALVYPEDHQWVGFGMNHMDLLARSEVYEQIRAWLAA